MTAAVPGPTGLVGDESAADIGGYPSPSAAGGLRSGRRSVAPAQGPRAPRSGEVVTCGGCDARWQGLAAAHCSVCHLTFASVSGFDRHRRGGCGDPAAVGLVLNERELWALPGRRPEFGGEEPGGGRGSSAAAERGRPGVPGPVADVVALPTSPVAPPAAVDGEGAA